MAKHKVLWNNGASLRLAELMGHEYLDETYKVLQDALGFFSRIREEDANRTIKVSEWKAWGYIYYCAHVSACVRDKVQPELDLDAALGHVRETPADIVEVLEMAVKSVIVKTQEQEGEATA